jgi:PAS domain-containing protein
LVKRSPGRKPHRSARGQALEASEERFRLLVESVQDYAIFMLDPQGRVLTLDAEGPEREGRGVDRHEDGCKEERQG